MADDLAVLVRVLDTSGALILSLTEANGYRLVGGGLTEGVRSHRRQTGESVDVKGRTLISAVLDVQSGQLAVRVVGTTHAELRTRLAAVRSAFEQRAFVLEVTIEGGVESWLCEAADSAIGQGGTYDEVYAMNLMQPITFIFPRQPL